MSKYCSKCGAKNNDTSAFCGACGNRFSIIQKTNKDNPVQSRNYSQFLFGILIFIAFIGLIALLSYSSDDFHGNMQLVHVGGNSFNIPEGYVLDESLSRSGFIEGTQIDSSFYKKGSSHIHIMVINNPSVSFEQYRENIINEGNAVEDRTIGSYSGFVTTVSDVPGSSFSFVKWGAIITIQTDLFSEEKISKIMD